MTQHTPCAGGDLSASLRGRNELFLLYSPIRYAILHGKYLKGESTMKIKDVVVEQEAVVAEPQQKIMDKEMLDRLIKCRDNSPPGSGINLSKMTSKEFKEYAKKHM
jgi:hypothetical protein